MHQSESHPVITDEMLAALTGVQRAELVAKLEALAVADVDLPASAHFIRRWFPRLLALSCLVLVPWIVILAMTLPRHYETGHWQIAWSGFDCALFIALAITAWSLWRQRQIAVIACLITATLLICDAWFDITTSQHGSDLLTSILSAALIEIPLAVSLLVLSGRIQRVNWRLSHGLPIDAPLVSKWTAMLPSAAMLRPEPRE